MINGESTEQNWTGLFKPGEKVRLRLINSSAKPGFFGSSEPCRYVPKQLPVTAPSSPVLSLFPLPLTTLPRGACPSESTVRPL